MEGALHRIAKLCRLCSHICLSLYRGKVSPQSPRSALSSTHHSQMVKVCCPSQPSQVLVYVQLRWQCRGQWQLYPVRDVPGRSCSSASCHTGICHIVCKKERELSERNNTRHKLLELSLTKFWALPKFAPSRCD